MTLPRSTRKRLHHTVFMLTAIAALAGCNGTQTLSPLEPSLIKGRTQATVDKFGICWPFDFDRSVPANPVPAPMEGEFTAGYNNHVRPGQSCNTQESFAYSGAAYFNLVQVHNLLITSATLRLDRRNTPVPVHVERPVPSGVVRENYCQLMVEIATDDWRGPSIGGSFASRPIPTRFPVSFQQDNAVIGIGVDVTWAVQQWALSRIPNYGFVIKPRPEDIGKNENTCTGYWSNPRLEITFARPAQE